MTSIMQNSHLLSYISRKNSELNTTWSYVSKTFKKTIGVTILRYISWKDVTTYLIDTPSKFTNESLKAYKSLEAYDYFVCGHVHSF